MTELAENTISVAIPTYNAGDTFNALLKRLRSQTIPCELIIMDSSSSDNTRQIAQLYGAKVVTISRQEFNHGRTRNLAMTHSSGDTVIFLTQDAMPYDACCVENLVKFLGEGGVAAAYGRQVPREDAKPTEKFARLFNYPVTPAVKGIDSIPTLGIKTFFFSNVCSAIKRKEFEEVGGFPEELLMFEDMIFAAKLLERGFKIAYVPEAMVIHSHNYSPIEQFWRHLAAAVSLMRYPWFLAYAKAEKEGAKLLKKEIDYFMHNRMYYWVVYALIESIFKYSGYVIGLNQEKLPHTVRKSILSYINV